MARDQAHPVMPEAVASPAGLRWLNRQQGTDGQAARDTLMRQMMDRAHAAAMVDRDGRRRT